MAIVVPPAGISPLGLFVASPGANEAISPILADNIDPRTNEYINLFVGDDIVDAQVKIALKVLRGSGPAVTNVGQRFRDIRKITNSTQNQIESQSRTALATLVANGDIVISGFEVEADPGSQQTNTALKYINLRSADRRQRSLQITLGEVLI